MFNDFEAYIPSIRLLAFPPKLITLYDIYNNNNNIKAHVCKLTWRTLNLESYMVNKFREHTQ